MNRGQSQIPPFVYFWDTRKVNSAVRRSTSLKKYAKSASFDVVGTNYRFHICLFNGTDGQSILSLKMEREDKSIKCFDLHVEIKLSYETKTLSFKDVDLMHQDIATLNKNNILNVTCTFFNIRQKENPVHVPEPNFSNTNENLEKVEGEVKKQIQSKGLTALSGNLKDLFLNQKYSDLVIKVGPKTYLAHKAIVLARCSSFEAILKSRKTEEKQVISISDCEPSPFYDFLLYLYTGTLDDISVESAFELYLISRKYKVKELEENCYNFILAELNLSNVYKILSVVISHGENRMKTQAIEFLVENAKKVLSTTDWIEFVRNNPIEANDIFRKMFEKALNK